MHAHLPQLLVVNAAAKLVLWRCLDVSNLVAKCWHGGGRKTAILLMAARLLWLVGKRARQGLDVGLSSACAAL